MAKKKPSEGEVRAFYEHQGKALAAYACSFGLDFALAQDVVQQVFLKVLCRESSLSGNPAGYLYRAVRNACLNVRRNGEREVPLEPVANWLVHRGGDRDAEIALQTALANLPDEQREVVIMHVWGGMTFEEVAAATATSLNTAASRYRYALDRLRKAFDLESQTDGKDAP